MTLVTADRLRRGYLGVVELSGVDDEGGVLEFGVVAEDGEVGDVGDVEDDGVFDLTELRLLG